MVNSTVPVSVIIANYNSAGYLDECIRSINAVQWPAEILVIDDCSTDDSLRLAKNLESEFTNVRVVQLHENSGAAAARKIGVFESKYDWITIVDADDFIEEDAVSSALSKAIQEKSEICIWQLWRFDSNRQWLSIKLESQNFPISGRQAVIKTLGKWKIHPLGVLKKNLYIAAYSNFDEKTWNADELISRLVFSEAQKVSLCEKRYFYRSHPNSTTKNKHIKHLTGLRSEIWLMQFAKNYPEVPPDVVGSAAISCAWRVLKKRKHYGNKPTNSVLKEFIPALIKHGDLKKWLWRHPIQLTKFGLIRLACKLNF